MRRKQNGDSLMDILRNGNIEFCPHFFICGSSESVREEKAIRIKEMIEENQILDFRGSVKSFTIVMPYFYSYEDADQFVAHLRNSYSIAKDCYDRFCGIIMIELDPGWGLYEFSNSLYRVTDYLKKIEDASIILLFPGLETDQIAVDFYNELSNCGNWMKVTAISEEPSKCIKEFRRIMNENGYSVRRDVQEALLDILQRRNESYLDNYSAVRQLASRIIFNKRLFGDKKKTIRVNDIVCISGMAEKKKIKIGFCK